MRDDDTGFDEEQPERRPPPEPAAPAPAGVALTADSAIQFVDAVVTTAAAAAVSLRWFECVGASTGAAGSDGPDDADAPALHQVTLDETGGFLHPVTLAVESPERTYAISGTRALETFAGAWLPIPCMRVQADGKTLDEGPSNWARVLIAPRVPISAGAEPDRRVVIAFDTASQAPSEAESPRRLDTQPTAGDVERGARFAFSADIDAVGWFVTEPWVDEWLTETFHENRRQAAAAMPHVAQPAAGRLEHLATYLTLLAALDAAGVMPAVRFTQPATPVAVDLVLDMGSSRTCILLTEQPESPPGAAAGIEPRPRVLPLGLRDIGEPWRLHDGILPSRIEFARAAFGKDAYSRWSGRTNAFAWPSLARVGAEALRLSANQPAADAFTGLSSPLHYIWDDRPSRHVWRFAHAGAGPARRNPLIAGPVLAFLSEAGDVLETGDRQAAATKPRFARAALTTFFAAEVLVQAIGAINSAPYRAGTGRPTAPRRLDRIVVTLPAALHALERDLVRRRLTDAVRLVWAAMGWTSTAAAPGLGPRPPEIEIAVDTATATQLAFLDREITTKLRGQVRQYCELIGKLRHGHGTTKSLRVATLDIGGGTTGLSIATLALSELETLTARRHLVEGFRTGTDDVARALVERIILPALEQRLSDCKLADARSFLRDLVHGATHGRASRLGEFRRRLAGELALPAAIAMLRAHETDRTRVDDHVAEGSLGALLRASAVDPTAAADELEQLASDEGAENFLPLETAVDFSPADVSAIALETLEPVLAAAIRAIGALDCDLVLIAGWASHLPAIRARLLEGMPIRPDRLIALGDHRFSASRRSASDPKQLAALGALLASRRRPRVGGSRLAIAEAGEPPRTWIGLLDGTGRVAAGAVLFDSEAERAKGADQDGGRPKPAGAVRLFQQAAISAEPPLTLGLRRAPLESWPALPMFVLALEETAADDQPRLPLKVTLEWDRKESGGVDVPRIVRALDADGIELAASEISLRLRTLGSAEGHWLDTGVLTLR